MNALDALAQARAVWEASQPQLTISGWADMLDGLDSGQVERADTPVDVGCCLSRVEPATADSPFPAGGLALPDEGGGALPTKSALHRQGGEH